MASAHRVQEQMSPSTYAEKWGSVTPGIRTSRTEGSRFSRAGAHDADATTSTILFGPRRLSACTPLGPDERENGHAFPGIDLDCDCGAVSVDSDGPVLRRCE